MIRRRTERRRLGPAVLIVILILGFSWVLLREGRLRDMDVARLGSLEAATAVAEASPAEGIPDWDEGMEAAVAGWGIYTPEGSLIVGRGSAPDRLEAPPSGPAVLEAFSEGILRTSRTMAAAPGSESTVHRSGTGATGSGGGGGAGMRRVILIDWRLRANGNSETIRIIGVAGLLVLTILLLVLQQRASLRLEAYQRDEERKRRLVQLGLAARTITHEIRNPLGTIKARTALLRRTLPAENSESLAAIDIEVERLNALTVKVRDWLSDPRGNPESFDSKTRLEILCKSIEWPVDCRIQSIDTPLIINMDPSLFDSTLTNLIRNASESQVELPDSPRIRIEIQKIDRTVRINVEDRGCGLPEGDIRQLFDPFFTTKTRGSGVGLSLALQAVEAAGGTLKLSSRKGGGTRACIMLPLEETR